jgi:hypothetical protein
MWELRKYTGCLQGCHTPRPLPRLKGQKSKRVEVRAPVPESLPAINSASRYCTPCRSDKNSGSRTQSAPWPRVSRLRIRPIGFPEIGGGDSPEGVQCGERSLCHRKMKWELETLPDILEMGFDLCVLCPSGRLNVCHR